MPVFSQSRYKAEGTGHGHGYFFTKKFRYPASARLLPAFSSLGKTICCFAEGTGLEPVRDCSGWFSKPVPYH